MRIPTLIALSASVLFTLACVGQSNTDGDGNPADPETGVPGNYEVAYADNLRLYVDDTLIATAEAGEDVTVEWNGASFDIDAVCGDAGTTCPSEAYWDTFAVEQPWGSEAALLNFISLDRDAGTGGVRIAGVLEADGRFGMLAGLDADGNDACIGIGVGTVEGRFDVDRDITDGLIKVEWAAGCVFGEVDIDGRLRLETDFTAVRTGDFDLGSIEAEPPLEP